MTVTEKVAYIKGLVDGLDLDAKKDEVKVIKAIIELLDDMAMSVSDLEEGLDVVSDQVDEIDEDLSDLEGYVYEDDDDCCCGDDDCYEIECPNCGEKHYIFGKSNLEQVAKDLDVKVLAQIPMDPAMATAMDQGAVESLEKNYLEPVADAILAHEKG